MCVCVCVCVCFQDLCNHGGKVKSRLKDGGKRRLTAEEREVSRLERKLKMKKRKRLPTAFKEDGLDCISHTHITHITLSHMHTSMIRDFLDLFLNLFYRLVKPD